jgi:SAM-dependent methyltransferase
MATRLERSTSFGTIAGDYDRFRPGPPPRVLDWAMPASVTTALDLGAGTGALTRLLLPRVPRVVSIEPDDRMRAVLAARAPTALPVAAKGQELPVRDGSADAALASSAWHWMAGPETVAEVHRVLRPGGVLAVMWTGPDRTTGLLARRPQPGQPDEPDDRERHGLPALMEAAGLETAAVRQGDAEVGRRYRHTLELGEGSGFSEPEQTVVSWTMPMTLDELLGLAGTYSVMITLPDDARAEALATIRAWLEAQPQLAGGRTAEVAYRCVCWRAYRLA